jgi:hypothetical protein
MAMNKRIATLTPEEDAEWEWRFTEYLIDKKPPELADELTWADMQKQFPRLKSFDGCHPIPAEK